MLRRRSGTICALRVLVVEDDEATAAVLVEVLESEGYSVRCARDGVEALSVLRAEHVAVMLVDVRLPKMNGFELRQLQLRDPELAQIPVVMMSADPELDFGALGEGTFLAKPFDVDDLVLALALALAESEAPPVAQPRRGGSS